MKESPHQLLSDLMQAGLVETEAHHEFTSGLHGRKADLDLLNTNYPFYSRTMHATATKIRHMYPSGALPDVLVSVTSGTDDWVSDIAEGVSTFRNKTQDPVEAVKTVRDPRNRRSIILGANALDLFITGFGESVEQALIVDDIGTQGTNAGMVVDHIREVSPLTEVRVLYIVQRSLALPELVRRNVRVDAVMNASIPAYTPEQCEQVGDCADGLPLVPYKYNRAPQPNS